MVRNINFVFVLYGVFNGKFDLPPVNVSSFKLEPGAIF